MKWTEQEDNFLKQNYQLTKKEILKLFPNRSKQAINIRACTLGLRKAHNEYVTSNLDVLLYESNEAYYWLGFILADGHIENRKRLCISLSIKDLCHLEKFKKFVNSKTDIKIIKNGQICSIGLQDSLFVPAFCSKFDIKGNKTYNPPKIDLLNMKNDLFLSFLAGFIDGDGNISRQYKRPDSKITIKLHNSWDCFLSNITKKLNIIYKTSITGSKINSCGYTRINIANNTVVKQIKRHVIKYGLPVLKRKWSIIDLKYVSRSENNVKLINNIKKCINNGVTDMTEISNVLNKKYQTIYCCVRKNNLL
jgi:hypothetical protein